MKRKILIIAFSIVLIAFGAALFSVLKNMNKDRKPAREYTKEKLVNAIRVEYSDKRAVVSATGRLRSKDKIEVYAEVGGIVLRTNPDFKIGTRFKKGEIMLEIDDEEASIQLKSLKSDLLSALTRIMPDLKADFPDAFEKWNSYLEKYEIDEPLAKLPEPGSPKEKYFIANNNIFKLYYAIKNQETLLEKYEIRAPFTGAVTASMVDPGALVAPGRKLGEFAGDAQFELELAIPERDLSFVSTGAKVIVSARDGSDEKEARIVRIGAHINPNTQTASAFAAVSGAGLKDGMYLLGEIQASTLEQVFEIPRKAVVGASQVYAVRDGILELERVEIVRLGEKSAYARGLKAGEIVVIDALSEVAPGTKAKAVFRREAQ